MAGSSTHYLWNCAERHTTERDGVGTRNIHVFTSGKRRAGRGASDVIGDIHSDGHHGLYFGIGDGHTSCDPASNDHDVKLLGKSLKRWADGDVHCHGDGYLSFWNSAVQRRDNKPRPCSDPVGWQRAANDLVTCTWQ